MAKIIGKICDKHPELGGERYAFSKGGSVCVACNVLRVQRFRHTNTEHQTRITALHKTAAYKKKFNKYRRDLRARKRQEKIREKAES
jgi:hypothetical protein